MTRPVSRLRRLLPRWYLQIFRSPSHRFSPRSTLQSGHSALQRAISGQESQSPALRLFEHVSIMSSFLSPSDVFLFQLPLSMSVAKLRTLSGALFKAPPGFNCRHSRPYGHAAPSCSDFFRRFAAACPRARRRRERARR